MDQVIPMILPNIKVDLNPLLALYMVSEVEEPRGLCDPDMLIMT